MGEIKEILELIPKSYRIFAFIILIFVILIKFFYKRSEDSTKTKIFIKGNDDQTVLGDNNTVVKGNKNSIK